MSSFDEGSKEIMIIDHNPNYHPITHLIHFLYKFEVIWHYDWQQKPLEAFDIVNRPKYILSIQVKRRG